MATSFSPGRHDDQSSDAIAQWPASFIRPILKIPDEIETVPHRAPLLRWIFFFFFLPVLSSVREIFFHTSSPQITANRGIIGTAGRGRQERDDTDAISAIPVCWRIKGFFLSPFVVLLCVLRHVKNTRGRHDEKIPIRTLSTPLNRVNRRHSRK